MAAATAAASAVAGTASATASASTAASVAAAAPAPVPVSANSKGQAAAQSQSQPDAAVDVRTARINLSANPKFPTHAHATLPDVFFDRGAVSRPMLWCELAFLTADAPAGPHHLLMGRTRDALERYQQHMTALRARYASVEDFVRHTKLGAPAVSRAGDGKLTAVLPPGHTALHFTQNDFPYATEPGLSHDLIWASPHAPSPALVHALCADRRPGCEFLTCVAPDAFKSVPGVYHIHVFSRHTPNAQPPQSPQPQAQPIAADAASAASAPAPVAAAK